LEKDKPIECRGRPNEVYTDLGPPLKVALKILEYNDVDSKDIYFSQLCDDLSGKVSRVSIHSALDALIDQGSLHSGWEKNEKGHWIRAYHIAGEEQKRQLRILYRASHDM
jgi:hypothetical protein